MQKGCDIARTIECVKSISFSADKAYIKARLISALGKKRGSFLTEQLSCKKILEFFQSYEKGETGYTMSITSESDVQTFLLISAILFGKSTAYVPLKDLLLSKADKPSKGLLVLSEEGMRLYDQDSWNSSLDAYCQILGLKSFRAGDASGVQPVPLQLFVTSVKSMDELKGSDASSEAVQEGSMQAYCRGENVLCFLDGGVDQLSHCLAALSSKKLTAVNVAAGKESPPKVSISPQGGGLSDYVEEITIGDASGGAASAVQIVAKGEEITIGDASGGAASVMQIVPKGGAAASGAKKVTRSDLVGLVNAWKIEALKDTFTKVTGELV